MTTRLPPPKGKRLQRNGITGLLFRSCNFHAIREIKKEDREREREIKIGRWIDRSQPPRYLEIQEGRRSGMERKARGRGYQRGISIIRSADRIVSAGADLGRIRWRRRIGGAGRGEIRRHKADHRRATHPPPPEDYTRRVEK